MYLAWIIFIGLLLILFLLSKLITNYYIDPSESYGLAIIITVFSLTISLLCVLLIPIDIFLVSRMDQSLSIFTISIDF